TTVVVTGDARNNYRDPRTGLLAEIASTARSLYWLNPEARRYWDTGDSVMGDYRAVCDGVYEVRTIRQLEDFIEKVALRSEPMLRRHSAPEHAG
ncbi:MAG: VWA domain-containing protein, partial [Acidimicrobiia bacterium]|nr:VWA domain-containing protein [Acidimicrobiia bacterium]